jgi:hypothetical protein
VQLNTIILPENLIWIDEFDWQQTSESKEYSLSGSLLIDTGTKLKGRLITLQGEINAGWITRTDILSLQTLANTNATMTLTLNDLRTFQVRFDYNTKSVEVKPIADYSTPAVTDYYQIILRLYEV